MIRRFAKDNSSILLTVAASAGVVTTAYLTGRASFQAAHKLEDEDPHMELKEKAKLVWKLYIPAGASAATTIVCVAGIKHVDGRKTLAAQAALAVSQRAYEGYRAEVIEELGERKDKIFLSKVAEKKIQENVPSSVVIASGKVLCCELYTGRYFESDMEALNKAVNEINSRLNKHDYATLDDPYYILGLTTTSVSGQTGWSSSRLLELEFSTVLAPDGRPCLAFDYNYVDTF